MFAQCKPPHIITPCSLFDIYIPERKNRTTSFGNYIIQTALHTLYIHSCYDDDNEWILYVHLTQYVKKKFTYVTASRSNAIRNVLSLRYGTNWLKYTLIMDGLNLKLKYDDYDGSLVNI